MARSPDSSARITWRALLPVSCFLPFPPRHRFSLLILALFRGHGRVHKSCSRFLDRRRRRAGAPRPNGRSSAPPAHIAFPCASAQLMSPRDAHACAPRYDNPNNSGAIPKLDLLKWAPRFTYSPDKVPVGVRCPPRPREPRIGGALKRKARQRPRNVARGGQITL